MSQITIEQALQIAMEHYQAGRFQDAEAICRKILAAQPNHPDGLHLLGVIAGQAGRNELAVELIHKAIAASPVNPHYHNNLGTFLQRQGRLDQAIACIQRALEIKPDYPEARYNLGNAFLNAKQFDQAIACYQRALELRSDYSDALNNLGTAWNNKADVDQAIACFRQSLAIKPDNPQAHNNLGSALKGMGRLDEAIACFQRALAIAPDYPKAHFNLGCAFWSNGQLDQAVASFQRALEIKSDDPEVHNSLGGVFWKQGRIDRAIACYQRALEINPDYGRAYNNLGNAWLDKRQLEQARLCYERAIAISPDDPDLHSNLGVAWKEMGQPDQAIVSYRRALALKPDDPQFLSNLGPALKAQGELDEAIACYRKALKLNPRFIDAHDNLLMALQYHPDFDARGIFLECQNWNHQHAEPLKKFIQPYPNDTNPQRRLRIGYVSPDLRDHPVGRFVLSLLTCHDHNAVEVFCYAQVHNPDEMTAKCQSHADVWRSIVGLSDEQAAEMIRQDRIDILVDLALHTAHNRLLVFARKPAPVQATFAGYPGTTGLETIDYRLTDPNLDPPDQDDSCYSEKSIRLPDTFWCDGLLSTEPPVNAPPAESNGYVTFGCLNNFCKVNDGVLSLWAKVLNANAGSHLLLMAPEGSARQRVLDRLGKDGITARRVEFVANQARIKYLQTYHRNDIGLDTFPYNGHATSFDSFWMGVPVITLVGRTVVGRAGLSQLTNLGLPELIAHTPEEYVAIATALANDPSHLQTLRATLRNRFAKSPLMAGERFARGVESAYRSMWRKWCAQQADRP